MQRWIIRVQVKTGISLTSPDEPTVTGGEGGNNVAGNGGGRGGNGGGRNGGGGRGGGGRQRSARERELFRALYRVSLKALEQNTET